MEEILVLEMEQRLNIVIFKIVQLIVNGQNGIMVLAQEHVEVAYKWLREQREWRPKMEEDLVLEMEQILNIVIFKIVQLIVNGQNGIMVLALEHVEVVNKYFLEQKKWRLKMEENLVLEIEQRPNFVIFKVVQLTVNGLYGQSKDIAQGLVEVGLKFLQEYK